MAAKKKSTAKSSAKPTKRKTKKAYTERKPDFRYEATDFARNLEQAKSMQKLYKGSIIYKLPKSLQYDDGEGKYRYYLYQLKRQYGGTY